MNAGKKPRPGKRQSDQGGDQQRKKNKGPRKYCVSMGCWMGLEKFASGCSIYDQAYKLISRTLHFIFNHINLSIFLSLMSKLYIYKQYSFRIHAGFV